MRPITENNYIEQKGIRRENIRNFLREIFAEHIRTNESDGIIDVVFPANMIVYRNAEDIYNVISQGLQNGDKIISDDQQQNLRELAKNYSEVLEFENPAHDTRSRSSSTPGSVRAKSQSFSSSGSRFSLPTADFSKRLRGVSLTLSERSNASPVTDVDYKSDKKAAFENLANSRLETSFCNIESYQGIKSHLTATLVDYVIDLKGFQQLFNELSVRLENVEGASINKGGLKEFYDEAFDLHVDLLAKPVIDDMLQSIQNPEPGKSKDHCEDNLKIIAKRMEQFKPREARPYQQKVLETYVEAVTERGLKLDKGGNKPLFGADKRDNLPYRGFKALCKSFELDHEVEYKKLKIEPSAPAPKSSSQLSEENLIGLPRNK